MDRRDFFKASATGLGAGLALTPAAAAPAPLTEKEKLARLASNTWPLRYLFESRTGFGRSAKNEASRAKYGAPGR